MSSNNISFLLLIYKVFVREKIVPFIAENISQNIFGFVKIILKKNNNFVLTLRKRLFYDAKPTLLPCKRAAFGMQNNRFYNTLITNKLNDSYSCEKFLH